MANTTVRLVNPTDDDFHGQYDREHYTIKAHSEGLVPWDAACLWLGDPRAADHGPGQNNRLEEYRRLTSKYGVYDENYRFDDARPKVETYLLDGTRVTMLCEDPFGSSVDVFADGHGQPSSEDRINELESLVKRLMAEKDEDVDTPDVVASGPTSDDDGNHLPVDEASAIPVNPPAVHDSGPDLPPDAGFTLPGAIG